MHLRMDKNNLGSLVCETYVTHENMLPRTHQVTAVMMHWVTAVMMLGLE